MSSARVSTGLLLLRLVAGIAFILHGVPKLAAPFAWMGPDAPIPGIFQALAVLAEVGGGAALILGLLVPLASLGLIFTMVGAVSYHLSKGDGFVQGYELALVYLAISILLFLSGPGKFSLDHVIKTRKK
ncbi:MAG TPA: DoxX family protein [Pseudobdellovibrionaceae bacterium]|nr:DoxX family protein [Pseudobdellovibrionaceae bacterium]